jgi:hypothetical protein
VSGHAEVVFEAAIVILARTPLTTSLRESHQKWWRREFTPFIARMFGVGKSFAGDPRLLLPGLGQDAAPFDRATRGTVLDHHQNPVGVDVGDPRHRGCDFRCETGGFVFRMT